MKKIILFVISLILVTGVVSGTTVSGTVYDYNLDKAPNSVIRINSTPNQVIVALDGNYQVELNYGNYKFSVSYKDNGLKYYYEELINIAQDGEYTLDIILLPDITDETNLLEDPILFDDTFFEPSPITKKEPVGIYFVLLGAFIIISYFYVKQKLYPRTKGDDSDDLTKEIHDFIKRERQTTQKEIRKQFPYSEAKISLVITELESNEKIKKIKKGRSNVIILK